MNSQAKEVLPRRTLGILVLSLGILLGLLFHLSFSAPYVLFSSDGPLGYIASQWPWAAHTFDGFWQDLNWIGSGEPTPGLNISMALYFLLGPVGFLKFYVPITLLILGIAAWYMLRRLNLSGPVCVLAGVAAALNTHPFSFACWGLGSLVLTFASAFFAAGLVAAPNRRWWHLVLAGLWIGLGVVEGFDNGAIMSLYISAWVILVHYLGSANKAKAVSNGVGAIAVLAMAAALFSTHTLYSLITTQIQGVAGMQQDAKTKEARWDQATQWSLPKAETLRVVVPGLYGYRMDTPGGGEYWGSVGQQPGWEQHHQGFPRHSGAGEYAGVLVVCGALLASFAALGRSKLLSDRERGIIIFWVIVAVISALFSYGRHAPFYRIIYSLPYFSTIRNPIKFMLPVQMALIVLFGYGMEYVSRRYKATSLKPVPLKKAFSEWWKGGVSYERRFAMSLLGITALSFLGYLIYASSSREMNSYLASVGFQEGAAREIYKFSLTEVRWTILFLVLSAGLLFAALSGWFASDRLKFLPIALGLVLIADLCRANLPWVNYYNYKDKYEENALLDFLKDRSFEHRVTARFHPTSGAYLVGPQGGLLSGVYNDWIQHQFQYYRIESLDVNQMPRVPELDQAILSAFTPKAESEVRLSRRLWELTNTRYLLAQKEFVQVLNQLADAGRNRFRILKEFSFVPKPGRTQVTTFDDLRPEFMTNGNFALVEFTGALPRGRIYNTWQMADDAVALKTLASDGFDPYSTLLVAAPAPAGPATNTPSAGTNKVEFVSYQPRAMEIQTESAAPGILLLNDKYDPHWHLTVDGKPETLLRCNYIMRGIYLPAGGHRIALRYKIPPGGLYVSVAAFIGGIALSCFVGLRALRAPQKE